MILAASLTILPALASAETRIGPSDAVKPVEELKWQSFVGVEAVQQAAKDPNTILIDARKPAEYAKGHIPGAINLPGESLRTPSTKPGKGDSQYFFRDANGQPDVQKYEQILSAAGIRRDQNVIVYGAHAGKADGSVAAMVLAWLGQENVRFFDGIGVDRWAEAGLELSTTPTIREPAKYVAKPTEQFVWNLEDVLANVGNKDVVFYDTRNIKEFTGEDKKDNQRGGHIPGAICIDYDEFLTKDTRTTIRPEQVRSKLLANGITPEKKIVLYCQTATRVSLPLLALRDLGYKNVYIYDASWHEYGNRQDTPVVEGDK
jgi:thiosulfate/3-mercaptopyruvate sulfurtransferase